jgi:hypothetical protein
MQAVRTLVSNYGYIIIGEKLLTKLPSPAVVTTRGKIVDVMCHGNITPDMLCYTEGSVEVPPNFACTPPLGPSLCKDCIPLLIKQEVFVRVQIWLYQFDRSFEARTYRNDNSVEVELQMNYKL